jgi:hypothetical protein
VGRTNFEQRLKRDIGAKNQISSRLGNLTRKAAGFQSDAETTGNRRKQKKYTSTYERLSTEIAELAKAILQQGDELEKRIHDEMKISHGEIQDFKASYEKEYAEAKAAAAKLKKAEHDWHLAERSFKKASAKDQKKLEELSNLVGKARAASAREQEDVNKAGREVESEERDKVFFRLELKRIAAERSALRK